MEARKVALVTGASSGIGMELARVHAERGGDLVVVARRRDRLETLKKEVQDKHHANVTVIVKDLTEPGATSEVYEEVKRAGVEVDYLINNAGFGGRGKFHEQDWEWNLAMINLNVVALTALTRFFLPDLIKRREGRVLNVSSTASLVPGPLQAIYYATKAYVTSFSNAVAHELRHTNVTVTALLPGPTETEFSDVAGTGRTRLFARASNARAVAEDGYAGMLAGKLNVISGVTFAQRLILALTPIAPRPMVLRIVRRLQEENAPSRSEG